DDGFGRVSTINVSLERGAGVALAHFGADWIQNEGNVRVLRGRDAKGFEEREMLRSVGEVIFAADNMGDAHFEIIDNVHKMEDRLAIGTEDDEIRVKPFAI